MFHLHDLSGRPLNAAARIPGFGFKIKIVFVDKDTASGTVMCLIARVAWHLVHHVGKSITSSDNLQTAFVDGKFFCGRVMCKLNE